MPIAPRRSARAWIRAPPIHALQDQCQLALYQIVHDIVSDQEHAQTPPDVADEAEERKGRKGGRRVGGRNGVK